MTLSLKGSILKLHTHTFINPNHDDIATPARTPARTGKQLKPYSKVGSRRTQRLEPQPVGAVFLFLKK